MKLNFKIGAKSVLIFVAALAAIITAIILNVNHSNNTSTQIANTVDIDNGDLKINWNRYESYGVELSETLNITKSGIYHLTGALEDGSININAGSDGVVKLILDNVTIKNSSGPAISCTAGEDLVIELVGGKNTVEDGNSYAGDYDEDVTGAIYSKADLTFEGDGALSLTANYQDGIVGKDDVKFNSGNYNITAADDGIRGKDSVYIVDGNFSIDSVADAIKSTNDTDASKGFVLIENGNMNINSGDDGIHAYRKLVIKNGNIAIAKSYEGLEAQVVGIDGGKISIVSSDDGINAGGGNDSSAANRPGANPFAGDENCILAINGGDIYINASGDGVDSNGWLYFNGGNVIVDGPTNNGNGALDSGLGIVMNGGTVIAVGASGMAETLGSTSSVYNASIYLSSTQSAGTKIEIKDASGNTVVGHTSAKAFNHISVGSEAFKLGETYTIYLNDEKYQTFTISNITTVVGGNQYNNTPGGGPGRR